MMMMMMKNWSLASDNETDIKLSTEWSGEWWTIFQKNCHTSSKDKNCLSFQIKFNMLFASLFVSLFHFSITINGLINHLVVSFFNRCCFIFQSLLFHFSIAIIHRAIHLVVLFFKPHFHLLIISSKRINAWAGIWTTNLPI